MWPASAYPSVSAVRADAVFASDLQHRDEPSAGQVRQAVAAAIRAFGCPGCAGRVAQEFGDHPETAVIRMRWARSVAARRSRFRPPGARPGRGVCPAHPVPGCSAGPIEACERGDDMTAIISDFSPEAGGRTKPRERPGGRQVLHGRAAEQRMLRDLLRRAAAGGGRRGAGGGGAGHRQVRCCSATPPTRQRSGAFRWPRVQRTRWARRSRSSRCARPCVSRSPGSPRMIPVVTCRMRPRGGSPSYEHTSNSEPPPARSCSAWMTCTGPPGHAGRAAGVAAGHQTAPGRLAPGPVKHAPPRHGVPVRSAGAGRCRRVTLGPLDQDAVAAMLTDAFGAPPDQALADLAADAAGTPCSWPS